MTNQEILTKAIEKAVANGWKANSLHYIVPSLADVPGSSYWVIFSHEFAKALWGEELVPSEHWEPKMWEYHLQQMVIADDPIKYLGENL